MRKPRLDREDRKALITLCGYGLVLLLLLAALLLTAVVAGLCVHLFAWAS
jgi:hypothetical protein